MGYSLLKTVFPNFGDTSTFVEHNYRQFLDEPETKATFESQNGNEQAQSQIVNQPKLEAVNLQKEIQYMKNPENEPTNQVVIPPHVTISRIENFDESGSSVSHIDYTHLMSCKECRELLQKQFAKKDSLVDDSLIEIGMYILFGAFILVLLEQK